MNQDKESKELLLARRVSEQAFGVVSPVLDPDEESEWLISGRERRAPGGGGRRGIPAGGQGWKGGLHQRVQHRLRTGGDPVDDRGGGQVRLPGANVTEVIPPEDL